jgi:hypothetical protein
MNRLVFVALLLSTFSSLNVAAQDVPISVTAEIRRDPKAILMLRQSLDALGGAGQWGQINCATIDGTVATSKDHDPSPIRIEYRWKDLSLQSRHEFTSGHSKVVRYADPNKGASISTGGKLEDLTGKARIADLPDKLPSAAFTIALGKAEYSITMLMPTQLEPRVGVKLLHYEKGHPVPSSEQDWYFSDTTSLPDHAVTYLRDMLHNGRLLRSRLRFVSYMDDGPVKVPSTLEETSFFGNVKGIVFQSVILNASQSQSDFSPSAEGGQQ